MLTQVLMGIVFIVLPLTITFALPIIQSYFSGESAFEGALEECETFFTDEARSVVQSDINA